MPGFVLQCQLENSFEHRVVSRVPRPLQTPRTRQKKSSDGHRPPRAESPRVKEAWGSSPGKPWRRSQKAVTLPCPFPLKQLSGFQAPLPTNHPVRPRRPHHHKLSVLPLPPAMASHSSEFCPRRHEGFGHWGNKFGPQPQAQLRVLALASGGYWNASVALAFAPRASVSPSTPHHDLPVGCCSMTDIATAGLALPLAGTRGARRCLLPCDCRVLLVNRLY